MTGRQRCTWPLSLLTAVLTLAAGSTRARAQAAYTATGPGKYISAGLAASVYDSDYGQTKLAGGTAFVDANLTWRFGLEGEARILRLHEDADGAHFSTYLGGPRISFGSRAFRPYAKLMAGRGEFTFPYAYGQGSYFVYAPGAGLDWRLPHSRRVFVRVIDVEYQFWPNFNYGAPPPYPTLHPIGVSTGVNIRLF